MAGPVVRLRAVAASDIERAIDHYRYEAGETVALEFIEALEQALARMNRSPHVGSLRFSYELDIPELRAMGTRRFPYLICYVPNTDTIDVWRVLHERRDIPGALGSDR